MPNPFEFDDCDDAFATAFDKRFQQITNENEHDSKKASKVKSKQFALNHNPFETNVDNMSCEQTDDKNIADLIQMGFDTPMVGRSKSTVQNQSEKNARAAKKKVRGNKNNRRKTAALPIKHENQHIEGYQSDSDSIDELNEEVKYDSSATYDDDDDDDCERLMISPSSNSDELGHTPTKRRHTEWSRIPVRKSKTKNELAAVRRQSYQLPTETKNNLNNNTQATQDRFKTLSKSFDIYSSLHKSPINLYEIGHILSTLKGNKENTAVLQKYLFYYRSDALTTPVFEIYHPDKGTHLVFGTYPRINDVSEYLKYHPILSILKDYNVSKLYTAVKYSKKNKSFNYQMQSLIKGTINEKTDKPITVENLNLIDEEYTIVNKEFQRQCDKLFDKVFSGKGNLKKVPFVDGIFIAHWNTFMTKYRRAIQEAFMVGDLKGYVILIAMFWAVVLQFKPNNRCKDLSKVLSNKMSKKIAEKLDSNLTHNEKSDASSITMVSFNLLFRTGGLFENLEKLGWTINTFDEEKIETYRQKSGAAKRNFGKEVDTLKLNIAIQKVGKHAKKVMKWSKRGGSSCLIM